MVSKRFGFALLVLVGSILMMAVTSLSSHARSPSDTNTVEYGTLVARGGSVSFFEAATITRFEPPTGDPPRPTDPRETTDNGLRVYRQQSRSVVMQSLNHLGSEGWRVVESNMDSEGTVRYLLEKGG